MEFISYDGYVFFNKEDKYEIDKEWTSRPRYLLDEILEKLFRIQADEEKDDYTIIIENNDDMQKRFVKSGKYTIREYDSGQKIMSHSVKTWQDRSMVVKRFIDITRMAKTKLNTIQLDKDNKVFKMTNTEVVEGDGDMYEV